MSKSLSVHYLPQFVAETDLAGATVVVIDLLRASTTICQALASGARDVTAFLEVEDVVRAIEGVDRAELVLAGERRCKRIEGFDLGNSPAEFTPDAVAGRRVFFTTTNGTRALRHARLAARVVVGAAVNLSSVVDAIAADSAIHLLCAGTDGNVTREDQLAAGAIGHALMAHGECELSDNAHSVIGQWRELLAAAEATGRTPSEQFTLELRDTGGAKNLLAIGMEADLARCAAIDALDVVPIFDPATSRLTLL